MVVVPFCLGVLVSKWWSGISTQIALAVLLPLFGSLLRLVISSLHDGSNRFVHLFRAVWAVGVGDTYVRQELLTLIFPVLFCAVTAVVFVYFQPKVHAHDA